MTAAHTLPRPLARLHRRAARLASLSFAGLADEWLRWNGRHTEWTLSRDGEEWPDQDVPDRDDTPWCRWESLRCRADAAIGAIEGEMYRRLDDAGASQAWHGGLLVQTRYLAGFGGRVRVTLCADAAEIDTRAARGRAAREWSRRAFARAEEAPIAP